MRRVLVAIAVVVGRVWIFEAEAGPGAASHRRTSRQGSGLRGEIAKPTHYVLARQTVARPARSTSTTAGQRSPLPREGRRERPRSRGRGDDPSRERRHARSRTRATGHREMGAAIAETFTRSGAKGTWASDEEHGSSDANGADVLRVERRWLGRSVARSRGVEERRLDRAVAGRPRRRSRRSPTTTSPAASSSATR